jgi:hypothetical protein
LKHRVNSWIKCVDVHVHQFVNCRLGHFEVKQRMSKHSECGGKLSE